MVQPPVHRRKGSGVLLSDKQLNESADILNEMQSYTDQLESPQKVMSAESVKNVGVSNPPHGIMSSSGK